MASINRGDNTGAFGKEFLRIYLNNPNNLYISKAVFQVNGELEKEYFEPQFPLKINLTGEETELLQQVNKCKLALWDELGRRRTADGSFTFFVKENTITSPDTPNCDCEYVETEVGCVTFDLEDPEFAAQFTIDAVPRKLSELQQDIPIMSADKIIGGRNVETRIEDDKVIIDADLNTVISYNDLEDKPTINGQLLQGDIKIQVKQIRPDWKEDDISSPSYIKNKPELSEVATSGLYNDLIGLPFIPYKTSELDNDLEFVSKTVTNLTNYYNKEQTQQLIEQGGFVEPVLDKLQELSDKEAKDVTILQTQINNKVDTTLFNETITDLATFDFVNNELNKKLDKSSLGNGKLTISQNGNVLTTFSANTKSNSSIDITVPTKVSDLENDEEFVKSKDIDLDGFVTKIDYDTDKLSFATHDEIGSGTFTIKVNENAIGTFNANSSLNRSVNIEVPTKLSELEEDIEILSKDDLTPINNQLGTLQTVVATIPPQITNLQEQVDLKVTKEPGKQLIDGKDLERLQQLQNYDDSDVRSLITTNEENITELQNELQNKVDKEPGKTLTSNDYSDAEKARLDNVENLTSTLDAKVSTLDKNVKTNTDNITSNTSKLDTLDTKLTSETTSREEAISNLQEQINALDVKSNATDIVATAAELSSYDTSKLKTDDIICVLQDETKNNTLSYYRWDGVTFFYIGSVAESYTKTEADSKYVPKERTINGKSLKNDIILSAEDIGALSNELSINDNTIMFKKNNELVDSITLNQDTDKTINYEVPTKTSELENDNEFINESFLFKYIGQVREEDNLQDQVDVLRSQIQNNEKEIEGLNELITGEIGGLPSVALTGSYKDLIDLPTKISDIKKNNKLDPSNKDYIDDTFITELKEKTGYVTQNEIHLEYAEIADLPTKVSELENDRGYVTNNAIGRGVLTLKINNIDVGTFMANEKDDFTWNIPVDNELSDTSTLPVQNNIVKGAIDTLDSLVVHLAGDEEITGAKTFTNNVTINGKTTLSNAVGVTCETNDSSTNLATTAYVKNQDYCTNTDAVHKDLEETITGNKTFEGDVTLNNVTANTVLLDDNSTNVATTAFVKGQDYCTNTNAVHKTGDETIHGDKTFEETVVSNGITVLGKYSYVEDPVEDDTDVRPRDKRIVNIGYLNAQLAEKEKEIQDLQSKINQANTTIGENTTTIQTLESTIQSLMQRIETLETRLETEIGDISTILDNINGEVI